MKRALLVVLSLVVCLAFAGTALAATTVPGKTGPKVDTDNNGYPDVGVVVVGHYTSVYAEDANGDYYWDLGDGRIQGTVGSIDELEQSTLTTCDYVVNYKGTFENNPFQDTGNIDNHILCSGYEKGHYNYQIVQESDPRYRGNPEWSIWGSWEYHVLTESKNGNLVRPYKAV
jgi:hypothetical protein